MFSFITAMFFAMMSFARAESNSSLIENEIKNLLYAHIVTYQPQAVGFSRFAVAMGSEEVRGPQWKEIAIAAKTVKKWPEVLQEKNTLVIIEGTTRTLIEFVDLKNGKININNKLFTYDPKASLLSQIKIFLMKKHVSTSQRSRINFLINEAWAEQNNPIVATTVATPIVVGGAISGLVLMGKVVAGAATLTEVAIPLAAGAAASGVLCSGIQKWMHGENFNQRYMNCIMAPLSWFGANPRDNLFLKRFEKCDNNHIIAMVNSPAGVAQKREFFYEGNKLTRVQLTDLKSNSVAKFSTSPSGNALIEGSVLSSGVNKKLNSDQIKNAQALIRDSNYYRGVCSDSARRDQIESGFTEGARAYDAKSPRELHENANK